MKNVLSHWNFDPSVGVIVLTLIVIYFYVERTGKRKWLFYWSGILLFIVATSSPLHFLAMKYYLSAHMIVHVLILLVCGPLIAAGFPTAMVVMKTSAISHISKLFFHYPWIAWLTGVLIMWIWHVPVFYNLAHRDMNQTISLIPALQSCSLLVGGIVFSWPIFGPLHKSRIHPLSGVVYLFTACISCSLLGLLITFAPATMYATTMANMQTMPTQVNPWHLTRATDQQAAGLIMWVPCCMVYLTGCFILLARWFHEKKTGAYSQSHYSIN